MDPNGEVGKADQEGEQSTGKPGSPLGELAVLGGEEPSKHRVDRDRKRGVTANTGEVEGVDPDSPAEKGNLCRDYETRRDAQPAHPQERDTAPLVGPKRRAHPEYDGHEEGRITEVADYPPAGLHRALQQELNMLGGRRSCLVAVRQFTQMDRTSR